MATKTAKKTSELVEGAHYQYNGDYEFINLGAPHGHDARLTHTRTETRLTVGCHKFSTEKAARAHYKPGYVSDDDVDNVGNRLPRPHGQALVDYAATICKTNGWKW